MEQQLFEQIQHLREQYPDLVVIIYGPTATGKSGLSLRLADLFAKASKSSSWGTKDPGQKKYNWNIDWLDSLPQGYPIGALRSEWQGKVEIISADSRQVYRYMNIGTDKISQADRDRVPHHGIDLIDPDGQYTAHQRQQNTKQRISDIQSRGNIPVIVGGTGLYIDTIYKNFSLPPDVPANRERRAELEKLDNEQPWYVRNLLNSFDPDTAAEFHPKNTRYIIRAIEMYEQTGIPKSVLVRENPVYHPLLMVSLTRDVDTANRLIHQRVEEMIERWLVAEVQWLLEKWYSPDLQSMNGIGYRQTIEVLTPSLSRRVGEDQHIWSPLIPLAKGEIDLINSISLASVQYAKRQRTRFRRYEKDAREHPKDRVTYVEIDMD